MNIIANNCGYTLVNRLRTLERAWEASEKRQPVFEQQEAFHMKQQAFEEERQTFKQKQETFEMRQQILEETSGLPFRPPVRSSRMDL